MSVIKITFLFKYHQTTIQLTISTKYQSQYLNGTLFIQSFENSTLPQNIERFKS